MLFLTDGETMYYVFYMIITLGCFFISPLFYSVLLTDVIKRSSDLMDLLKVVTYNYKKLLKSLFLVLIWVYAYALVGLLLF